jgi:cell wall-associated NlpC family hydrolase
VASAATADPGTVASKQAQAKQVLGQIQQIDASLERAVEAYDLANVKLGRIDRDLKRARFELSIARSNLRHAQATLSRRLVAIYVSGDTPTTLEVLLGARTLDDLLNRIETVNRVSDQDARVIDEVTTFRTLVARQKASLDRAHAAQAKIVAARAAAKRSIEGQLAERRALLSTIRGQIAHLQAEERARQARLAEQLRARVLQQRSAPPQGDTSNALGVAGATPEGTTVAPPGRYGGVVGIAMRYLGTPYVYGGASPGGFDCSGLVMYVYAQVGVSLPHSSYAQYSMGVPVSRDQLQPGDLVFFDGLGHVGIYAGGGTFIHAPHTGDVVKISSLSESWYASTYVGARRIL